MVSSFDERCFETGGLGFTVHAKPVSAQNKNEDKQRFKKEVQKVTSKSEFIITGTCWVSIDYYCQHVNRRKNPRVYDIDNIVKPILDSLVGQDGLLVDDVLVDRVIVNWIDTGQDDYFEVQIEYPDLLYLDKKNLVMVKSESGWCFPTSSHIDNPFRELIRHHFSLWDSINTEDDYYAVVGQLPWQNFIYYSKIKDRGYTFISLSDI